MLRRLDSVLKTSKAQVLAKIEELQALNIQNLEPVLNRITGYEFHNTSKLDFESLLDDPDNLAANLTAFINAFSVNAKDVMDYFGFVTHIDRLDRSNLLYQVMQKFASVDLHPEQVSNTEMGYIFEELIRKFAEHSNETAGEHFTPREVIRLMVNLLFNEDGRNDLSREGIVKTIYDPACGTGGMLSNPPFGVEWKKAEHEKLGMKGRFGAGLPRISDGPLLFLQHIDSKMKDVSKGGSRVAIVFNGSPLISGGAESGESNIRRWIIENDWLEAVTGLPDQLFYNTGISTYIWVLSNRSIYYLNTAKPSSQQPSLARSTSSNI